jgi:hypothetical protein
MKKYETIKDVEIVKEYKKHILTSCDFCGASPLSDFGDSFDAYVGEELIEIDIGTKYPEGSNFVRISVDLCQKCAEEKLIPWLRENSINEIEKEFNF